MTPNTRRLRGMALQDVPKGVSILAVAAYRLSRHLKSEIKRVVSHGDVTSIVAWRVLVGLSMVPDATQKELVEFTRTEQAQLSRALKDMEACGLVKSAQDLDDKRSRSFSVTLLGEQKYQSMLPDVLQMSETIDAALDSDEQLQFLSMCERISDVSRKAGLNQSQQKDPVEGSILKDHMEETK